MSERKRTPCPRGWNKEKLDLFEIDQERTQH